MRKNDGYTLIEVMIGILGIAAIASVGLFLYVAGHFLAMVW